MRIISGKYKGRTLHPPAKLPVRPTTDFAKTGLFNLLDHRVDFEQLECLDLFAGTGSISFELISRGCKSVVAVDKNGDCIGFIAETCKKLSIVNLTPVRYDCLLFLKGCKFSYDLVFADPPYELKIHEELHRMIFAGNILREGGSFVLEHSSRENYDHLPYFSFSRTYGNVGFTFFSKLVPSDTSTQ